MKLVKFRDYEEYVRIQSETNKEKIHGVWATRRELAKIAGYIREHIPEASFGICHGVRNGWEVQKLQELLGVRVIGTEISETAGQFPDVIQWDFHDVKEEWLDQVDFIYSNSWDHSYDPEFCLDQWMKCIKPEGRCFIEWAVAHGESGVTGADCFGASSEEYREIFSKNYVVERVLKVYDFSFTPMRKNLFRHGHPGITRLVFVIKHR